MKDVETGVVDEFLYSDGITPDGYECDDCGVVGVRLYRDYNIVLTCQHLRCRACALKNQEQDAPDDMNPSEHSIGWLVAAVPTEEGYTFWGYCAVPPEGVDWWDNLPKE